MAYIRRGTAFAVLVVSISISFTSHASTPDVALSYARSNPKGWLSTTLHSVLRPSLSEVIHVLRNCSDCVDELSRATAGGPSILSKAPGGLTYPSYRDAIERAGPDLVAFFEAFYPNGTYATLGRDAYLIADVLEAYYVGQNLVSPVVRLNASSPTVKGELAAPGMARKFLESNHFDLQKAVRGEKPFVIIDRTYYTALSQSVHLLRSIFGPVDDPRTFQQLGQYVNAVSTTNAYKFDDSVPKREWTRRFQAFKLDTTHWQFTEPSLPPVLQGPEGIGAMVDVNELCWHPPFSASVIKLEDGRLSGMPTHVGNVDEHLRILQAFWEIYKIASAPEFRQAVYDAADAYGTREQLERRIRTNGRSIVLQRSYENELLRSFKTDLEEHFSSVQGVRESAMLSEILAARERPWLAQMDQLAGLEPHEFGRRLLGAQQRLARRRLEVAGESLFARLLAEFSLDLPELAIEPTVTPEPPAFSPASTKGEPYFSANASALRDFVLIWRLKKRADGSIDRAHPKPLRKMDVASVAALLRQIEQNFIDRQLSELDLRRFTLFSLSFLAYPDPSTLRVLGETLKSTPNIFGQLVANPRLFLTSTKFYKGRARSIYRALVEGHVLPRPYACESLLEGDVLEPEDVDEDA